jgi:hypothetical protein
MGWLVASFSYLPFCACSGVLLGLALWGWRRTGATGALLIAIAGGLGVLHQAFGLYGLWRMFHEGPAPYGRWVAMTGAAQSGGALIADVLVIVGVALLLRRIPRRR